MHLDRRVAETPLVLGCLRDVRVPAERGTGAVCVYLVVYILPRVM